MVFAQQGKVVDGDMSSVGFLGEDEVVSLDGGDWPAVPLYSCTALVVQYKATKEQMQVRTKRRVLSVQEDSEKQEIGGRCTRDRPVVGCHIPVGTPPEEKRQTISWLLRTVSTLQCNTRAVPVVIGTYSLLAVYLRIVVVSSGALQSLAAQ
jgi:hypothetical protein